MALTREQLLAEALLLDPLEREMLAEELLLSVHGLEREAIDAAWLEEARSRDAAFRRGESGYSTVDEIVSRILSRDGR